MVDEGKEPEKIVNPNPDHDSETAKASLSLELNGEHPTCESKLSIKENATSHKSIKERSAGRKSTRDLGFRQQSRSSIHAAKMFTAEQFSALKTVFDRCDVCKKSGTVEMTSFVKLAGQSADSDAFLRQVLDTLSKVANSHLDGNKTFLGICCVLQPTIPEEKLAQRINNAFQRSKRSVGITHEFQKRATKSILVNRLVPPSRLTGSFHQEICLEKLIETRRMYDAALSLPFNDDLDACLPEERKSPKGVEVLSLKRLALYFQEDPNDEDLSHQFHAVAGRRDTAAPNLNNGQLRMAYLDFDGFCDFIFPTMVKPCKYPEPDHTWHSSEEILSWLYQDSTLHRDAINWLRSKEGGRRATNNPDATWPVIPSLPNPNANRCAQRRLIMESRVLQDRKLEWSRCASSTI